MDCKLCANLLAAYKNAVSLYTTSVSEIKPQDEEMKSLRLARRYRYRAWMAGNALMAHWRADHNGPAAKTALGNVFCLCSQEAEQLRQSRRHADDALIAHWCQNKSGPAAKGASL
jgi:hypothetical protein